MRMIQMDETYEHCLYAYGHVVQIIIEFRSEIGQREGHIACDTVHHANA